MFKLQRHFRPFLRGATVFEGIGKLVFLANPHQELRLREEFFAVHPGLLAPRGERGEVDVGREILLAGGLVRIGTGGVMAIRHERATVATRQLLIAGVAVIDRQRQALLN